MDVDFEAAENDYAEHADFTDWAHSAGFSARTLAAIAALRSWKPGR